MKMSIPTALALALLTATSANAAQVPQTVIGSSSTNVYVEVDQGVATIRGSVEGHTEKALHEQAALKIEGVNEVRNYLFTTK